jgi:hypothetical protein
MSFFKYCFCPCFFVLSSPSSLISCKVTENLSAEFGCFRKIFNSKMHAFSESFYVMINLFSLLQCYLELKGEPQLLQGLLQCSLRCTISITTVLPPPPPLFSLHHLHPLQVHMCIHQLESSVKQSDRDMLNFVSCSCSLFSSSNTQVDDQINTFKSLTTGLPTTVLLRFSCLSCRIFDNHCFLSVGLSCLVTNTILEETLAHCILGLPSV